MTNTNTIGETQVRAEVEFETETGALKVQRQTPAVPKRTDMTLGETRVRTTFNPSDVTTVDLIKQKTAELIDICEEFKARDPRLAAIAQTTFEDAAMWAVKLMTA